MTRACGDAVTLSSSPAGCRRVAGRTRWQVEDRVLALRIYLRDHDLLGEYGAAAIQWALVEDAS